MADTYHYDSLPDGRWIRLLSIEPGEQNDPVRCALVPIALDRAPAYRALSYVWGDPASVGLVTCSGFERTVTLSLLGGLRQLRHSKNIELVWADAICINQADVVEKANQVNVMGTIYDKAAEVLVWLGDDPGLMADHAFGALPRVNYAVVTGNIRTWSDSDYAINFSKGVLSPTKVSRSQVESMLNDQQLEAIKQLYRLPWFTRVWVLQEVGLATKATACWGNCRIDFSEIALFVWFAMNEHDLVRHLGSEIRAIISGCPYNAVYGVWSTYGKQDSWIQTSPPLKAWADHLAAQCNVDFVLVLEAARNFNATDPRDHVFAFLGHPCAILPGAKEPLVKADYEHDLEHLYCRVAQGLARTSLNFLVQAQNTAESLRSDDPASWIPRWDSSIDDAPNAFWEAWDASLRISKQYTPPVRILERELYISALLFDTMEHQTGVMTNPDLDRLTGKIGFWLEECWNLTERAAETIPHKYQDNHVLAFASILQCVYVPKVEDDRFSPEKTIGDFIQACIWFNRDLYVEKLEQFRFTYKWTILQYREFAAKFLHVGGNRRFFVTKGGYWGLGPAIMQEGDVCAVLLGADVPFVLRPTAEKGTFRLVGQAYLYGVMYGEIIEGSESGAGSIEEEICIV